MRHIVGGAPVSGGSGVSVRGGQWDLHRGRSWSRSEGDKVGSLSGCCIHFWGGKEECGGGSVECVGIVVLQMLGSVGR